MSSSALVKDYMTKEVITVHPETPNEEVIMLMRGTGQMDFLLELMEKLLEWLLLLIFYLKNGYPLLRIMSTDIVVAKKKCQLMMLPE